MEAKKYYIAYGSNLSRQQMAQRQRSWAALC